MYRTIRLAVFALGVFAVGSVAAQVGQVGQVASDDDESADGAQPPEAPEAAAPTGSVSVGMTNAGRVLNSVELEDAETHRVKRGSEDSRWGTAEMVSMVVTAAAAVAAAHPVLASTSETSRVGAEGGRALTGPTAPAATWTSASTCATPRATKRCSRTAS